MPWSVWGSANKLVIELCPWHLLLSSAVLSKRKDGLQVLQAVTERKHIHKSWLWVTRRVLLLEVAAECLVLLNLYSKKPNPNKPEHPGTHRASTCNDSHDSTDISEMGFKTEATRKAENTKQSSSQFKCAYRNKVNAVVTEILNISYVTQGNVLQIILK